LESGAQAIKDRGVSFLGHRLVRVLRPHSGGHESGPGIDEMETLP